MKGVGMAPIALFVLAVAAGSIAWVVANSRKRQSARKRVAEAERRKAEEVDRKAEEDRQRREAEEAQRKAEEERLQREAEEAQRKAEEERLQREAEEAQRRAGEDRLRREAEETKRKADEDRLRRKVEEVQRKAEEDHSRREGQEAERKAEEQRQRREAEEEQRKAEKEHQRDEAQQAPLEAGEGHKRPPGAAGGRPRGPTVDSKEQVAREPELRQRKPEIVCCQRERRWILAVEVPENLWEKPGLMVRQDALPLVEQREGCWHLGQARGQVTVHWYEDEGPQEASITLDEENYLLFKLSGQDRRQGRRVKSPSSGSYLVVVPEGWRRDEELSGPPPTSPQPVSVEGYLGHFFDLERSSGNTIALRTSEGEPIRIKSKATQFKLVGTRLEDAGEGVGPLFGERPPRIQTLHDDIWANIGTVVIGEEGSGRQRWRRSFSPDAEGREQNVPAEAAPGRDGWYFLRFYDTSDDLVESLDFRLVSALRDIKILQAAPFPFEGGHQSVYVEFRHEPGFVIQPADDLARSIRIESKNRRTILTIPPESSYDETRWRVGSEGKPQVQVTILAERLWWAVGSENNPPSEWADELLTLACDEFLVTSQNALWLRLPKPRWADRVLVGFEQSKARPCPLRIAETETPVPLRDFCDCQEMRDRDRDHFLSVRVERNGELVEGIVAIIPASRGPILCMECGRKERAIATAVLRKGAGAIKVNGQPVEAYFARAPLRAKGLLLRLLELSYISKVLSEMEVSIVVTGSNPRTVQQAKASAHALARAMMRYDSQLRPLLRREGFGGAKVPRTFGVQ